MCDVVGVASPGKVWCFFLFIFSLRGAEKLFDCSEFRTFSDVGNSQIPYMAHSLIIRDSTIFVNMIKQVEWVDKV